MSINERYVGRPFLRLLECYVLESIGELTAAEKEQLTSMTPKLQELYKVNGSWDKVVATVMELPDSFGSQVKSIWMQNRDKAALNGEQLLAQDFAEMFVDHNFPNVQT